MRRAIFLLLLVAFWSNEAFSEPLKIGALFHLTGEFATQGVAFREGAELALDEVHRDGFPELQIVFEDTRYLPVETNTGAKRLSELDGLQAVLISTLTEAKTASPVLTARKIPMLVLWDSSPELEALSPYIFGFGPWTPNGGAVPAEFAFSKLKARNVIIINSNTEWSLAVSKFFQEHFETLGGKIVETYTANPGDPDFLTILTRARLKHADAAFTPIDGTIPQFFSQAQRANLNIPILTADLITEDNLQESAEVYNGIYQAMVADPSFPQTAEMLKAYEKKFGHPCTQSLYVAWAYDAVKVLALALRNGARGGQAVREALLKTTGYAGAGGTISLDGKQSSPRAEKMFRIKDGKYIPLKE